jgi:hypothetical protein
MPPAELKRAFFAFVIVDVNSVFKTLTWLLMSIMITGCATSPMSGRDLAKLQHTSRITLMSCGVAPDGKIFPRHIVIDSPEEIARMISTIHLVPLPRGRVFGDLICREAVFETDKEEMRMAVSTTRFGPYWMPKEFYQLFESYYHDDKPSKQ